MFISESVTTTSEVELVRQQIGMEELVAYQETVFLICLGFTRDHWEAQELAQEAYLQAQQRLHQLRQADASKAWLCRLTRNICLDHLRSWKWRHFLRLDEVEEGRHENTPEALLQVAEQFHQVKAAIRKLPPKLRDVLILRAYADLSYDEIAQVLGIRMGTVMSRLARARTLVKGEVKKGGTHE